MSTEQLQNLTFGQAIESLKKGEKVARSGWNGKNMFIYLNHGIADFSKEIEDRRQFIEGISSNLFSDGNTGVITRLPNLNMKSASESIVTGWLASQTDILAEDWCIVE